MQFGKHQDIIAHSKRGKTLMRRIAAAQVATMVAGLVLGNSTSAEETFTMPTINVTGQYNTVTMFGWRTDNIVINSGSTPSSLGNNTMIRSAEHRKAIDCAKAYTNTGPGAGQGHKPGASLWMTNNYGWYRAENGVVKEVRTSKVNTSPGPEFTSAAAITFNKNITYIFTPNNPTMASMVESVAHEWAHQWGASDSGTGGPMDADAIGKAARAAYEADAGAKCGGL